MTPKSEEKKLMPVKTGNVELVNLVSEEEQDSLVVAIRDIVLAARQRIANNVNLTMIASNWQIGYCIVEHEQNGSSRAPYGRAVISNISKKLKAVLGRGFSVSNLQLMRKFYLEYPQQEMLSDKLNWSQYCELMIIEDTDKRNFYEKECVASRWSGEELKRQIDSSLFERLLLSKGDANKREVLRLAKEGHIIEKPQDILKDPYVIEFMDLPEDRPVMEKDIEDSLVRHIEKFLLELGKGFMYVGRQKRITVGNEHYYVDMVFYNKILKAYVLIDLKTTKLKPEHFGQMELYVNYYTQEVNEPDDNPAIGILLCAEKDKALAEFMLGNLPSNIFASKYVPYIPNKQQLIAEVEKALRESKEE